MHLTIRHTLAIAAAVAALTGPLAAQGAPMRAGGHYAVVDAAGVIRWADTHDELRLFGANYAITSSSDYRAAGLVSSDRRAMIDDDVAHFARMGWTGMRLAFWGDWQSSDRAGNLLRTDHLDLLDYLVARARERGISILLNPIHTYDAGWPDAEHDTFPGFAAHIPKDRLGTDPAAMAAQVNYLHQLLAHVNPYTGIALADEPAIVFIEMINEPIHHPEDLAGSVRYIDTLVGAVRASGSRALTFHNVSQDFRIAEAIRRSRVDGATFGWYPTGLNAGHELRGNSLRAVDAYPALRDSTLAGRPRLVYEFDTADEQRGEMYPAMARVFRQGGVQVADMFAYDMLATASRNLGWQTHRLNLVYTPRKAMSAVIAAEVMRRLPAGGDYGPYPRNRSFGPFRVSYEDDLSEMVTDDAFLNAGATRTAPPHPERLRRVAGYGSSPVVQYEGEGTYFLDRVRPGVWRLEVYPDAVDVDDPFVIQRRDKLVTRAIARAWPMTVRLPDLGASFVAQPLTAGNAASTRATDGRVVVRPGVYVLSAGDPASRASLPARLGALAFTEFHAPATDAWPTRVFFDATPEVLAGRPATIAARVASDILPDSVTLWLRPVGRGWFTPAAMRRVSAYGYRATLPTGTLEPGPYDAVIAVRHGDSTVTYPDGVSRVPRDWDFHTNGAWPLSVVNPRTPLRLLDPAPDATRLTFTRLGDAGRAGLFHLVPSAATGATALRFELPPSPTADPLDDYTASLVVDRRIAGRQETADSATAIRVRLRGLAATQRLYLSLMERDGTTWGTTIDVGTGWTERTIPLAALRAVRGVNLPLGYPGRWNYWVAPAAARGGRGDRLRASAVERLQLSLRPPRRSKPAARRPGVEVESVTLLFDR